MKKDGSSKFITCVGYPSCKNSVWFPGIVKNVEVTERHCEECGPDYKLLKFTFRPNPLPGEPNPNVLCIGGCDTNVSELLNISSTSVRRANGQLQPRTHVQVSTNVANSTLRTQTSFNEANRSFGGNTNGQLQQRTNVQVSNNVGNSTSRTQTSNNEANRSFGSSTSLSNRSTLGTVTQLSVQNRLSNGNFSGNTSTNDEVVCRCGQQALQLTVRKEGPNKGRQFYKCPQSVCDFFLWDPNETTHNNQSNIRPVSDIKCRCNQPATLRTVNKEGPNKGRQFYSCSKITEGCNFFQWADETINASSYNDGHDDGGGGGGGENLNWSFRNNPSRGRGKRNNAAPYNRTNSSRGAGTRAKRKCGNCGQEGHTRNRCPNN